MLLKDIVNRSRRGEIQSEETLKGKRVVISVDGGRTKFRLPTGEPPNPKTKRKPYKTDWFEPKLLTIYTVDERGKKVKNGEIPIINDGTYGDFKDLLALLEMYLVSLGIQQAEQVLLVADAAPWIWLHIPLLLERLGGNENY